VKRVAPFYSLLLAVAIAVAACQSAQPSATPPPTAPPPANVPSTPAATARDQIAFGKSTFQGSCTCHGGGFSSSVLARYGTAQKLLEALTKTMPQGNPGSLSAQQYSDVVAYVLSQAGLLQAGQIVNSTTAPTIQLK
jgi:hypothetical protein